MVIDYKALEREALWVRQKVVEMAVRAKSGHITSAFSQTELLVALYLGKILRYDPKRPKWDKRDRFILSKGHGGIGLYPILARAGFIPEKDLDNFAGEGSVLGVHAEWHIPGMEIISGSLGHGLPLATGICQAARIDKKEYMVFCLLGDAELYEGSNWEAMITAGSQRYDNLICIVDRNQQGTLGFTDRIESPRDGPKLENLAKKFKEFGFEVREIDGHSFKEIFNAFKDIRKRKGKRPLAIIAKTVKGKGSSLFENKRLWHYRVPEGDDLKKLLNDLGISSIQIESCVGKEEKS